MSACHHGEYHRRPDSPEHTSIGARVRAATWSPVEPSFGRMLAAVLMAMAAAGLVLGVAFLSVAAMRTGDASFVVSIPVALLPPRGGRQTTI